MVFKTPKYTKGNQMNPKPPERGSTGMNSTFFIQTLFHFIAVTLV